MASAVFWDLLEAVQSKLQSALTFSVQEDDSVRGIEDDAIVIRKLKAGANGEPSTSDEHTPGLLIVPGDAVAPPEEGTNLREDVTYGILIQLIDSDYDRKTNNLASYLKWLEQIRKYFSFTTALHASVTSSKGCVNVVTVRQVFTLDDRQWARHENFVGGVIVEVNVREPRGVTE